jgi:hypothetical protein
MSGNEFLITHGEKLGLAVVVGLSAWAVTGTIGNPEVLPKGVNDVIIDEMIRKVENARRTHPAPQIKIPPDYVAALKRRLDGSLPATAANGQAFMPWLTGQPDVGPRINDVQPLYIYELLPPRVKAEDKVGTIELTIAMPDSTRPTDGSRIADNAKREWKAQGGKVMNSVERAGVLIDYCIGNPNGTYKPLVAEGIVDGFAPMAETEHASFKVVFKADAVWETYFLRVRLVVRATGYPVDKAAETSAPSTSAVLVCQGRYDATPVWPDLEAKIRKGDPEALERFIKAPLRRSYEGAVLKPGEGFFASTETACQIAVTAATRFTFEKTSTGDDGSLGASMLVTTLLPPLPGAVAGNVQGGVPKWLFQPETFRIKKGEKLGDWRIVPDPRKADKSKSRVDLSTPFALDEVKTDVKRILYYELDTTSREAGGGQRDLIFKPKEKDTEAAVLKNSATGQTRPFTRLIRIEKPYPKLPAHLQLAPGQWTKIDGPFIYPDFPDKTYDEAEEFKKNPAEFRQRDLVPPAPVWHEANTGPIVEQRKKFGGDYQTDTKYLEFADGRVFFWDAVNKRILNFAIPNSEADIANKTRKNAPPKPVTPPPAAKPKPK